MTHRNHASAEAGGTARHHRQSLVGTIWRCTHDEAYYTKRGLPPPHRRLRLVELLPDGRYRAIALTDAAGRTIAATRSTRISTTTLHKDYALVEDDMHAYAIPRDVYRG